MDDLSSGENAALVILAFLQADCNLKNVEYDKELFTLGTYLNQGPNCTVSWINALDGGNLETDGHLESDGHPPGSLTICLDGIEPSVELHRNRYGAAALHQIAEELRDIAARLEHNVVAQATQNLRRNISSTPCHQWSYYLDCEVERVMRGVMGLEHPWDRVIMAVALTLVKGVCQQAPLLLRNLFHTAMQYIVSSSRAR